MITLTTKVIGRYRGPDGMRYAFELVAQQVALNDRNGKPFELNLEASDIAAFDLVGSHANLRNFRMNPDDLFGEDQFRVRLQLRMASSIYFSIFLIDGESEVIRSDLDVCLENENLFARLTFANDLNSIERQELYEWFSGGPLSEGSDIWSKSLPHIGLVKLK